MDFQPNGEIHIAVIVSQLQNLFWAINFVLILEYNYKVDIFELYWLIINYNCFFFLFQPMASLVYTLTNRIVQLYHTSLYIFLFEFDVRKEEGIFAIYGLLSSI